MYNFLKEKYQIEELSSIKITPLIYRINTNKGKYIVKEVKDDSLNKIYARMELLNIEYFNIPLINSNNLYINEENDHYYEVLNYYNEENISGFDLKISFFIKAIALMHKSSYVNINASDHYLESTLNFLDEQIKNISEAIESRIEVIERNDYHSPNEWFFLLNYDLFQSSLEEASRFVLEFENKVKESKKLRICLTYQNFSFDHVILKQEKIISTEKIAYNIASYDLYNVISSLNIDNLDITSYVEEYLKINDLLDYEKDYLLAVLYIFPYHRFQNNFDDLKHLIYLKNYLEKVKNINEKIIFSSPSEE